MESTKVTVETIVAAPISKVWNYWNEPIHIMKWNFASPEWHSPYADNDLKIGGKFKTTMAAKDGSFGFDFEGVYTAIEEYKYIAYKLADDREVNISFTDLGERTQIVETFDAETENPVEMQKGGWQAILNNFKSYTENN